MATIATADKQQKTTSHNTRTTCKQSMIGPSRSKARRTRRMTLGAFSAAGLGLVVLAATSGTTDSNNAISNLRRQLAEVTSSSSSSTTTSETSRQEPKIKFFVKTSGTRPYLSLATNIAESWGKEITQGDASNKHRITFLEDSHSNPEGVDALENDHPWIAVERVRGTDCQGDYKIVGGDVNCAHWAQRLKTRAVFDLFGKEAFQHATGEVLQDGQGGSSADASSYFNWLCYFDDDNVINVDNLVDELRNKHDDCSPNCFIADAPAFGNKTPYPAGGWCMERMAAMRVHKLLATHSDEDLGWMGNDDLAFSMVLNEKLGISVTNSDLWYSEISRPIIKDGQLTKSTQFQSSYFDFGKYPRIEWSKNHVFLEMWLPSLSVYNVRKSRPTNIAKAEKMIESSRIENAIGSEGKTSSASYATSAVAPTLIMSTPEQQESTISMLEEEYDRKLGKQKQPFFTLVEPELPLQIPGEPTHEEQHEQRMLEDEKEPEAMTENKDSTPPKIAYRSDVKVQGTNERNLESEALPFTLVEPELPLTIPGMPTEE